MLTVIDRCHNHITACCLWGCVCAHQTECLYYPSTTTLKPPGGFQAVAEQQCEVQRVLNRESANYATQLGLWVLLGTFISEPFLHVGTCVPHTFKHNTNHSTTLTKVTGRNNRLFTECGLYIIFYHYISSGSKHSSSLPIFPIMIFDFFNRDKLKIMTKHLQLVKSTYSPHPSYV